MAFIWLSVLIPEKPEMKFLIPETNNSFKSILRNYFMRIIIVIASLLIISSCKKDEPSPTVTNFQLNYVRIGSVSLNLAPNATNLNMPVDQVIVGSFTDALDVTTVSKSVFLINGNDTVPLVFSFLDENKTFSGKPNSDLGYSKTYSLEINSSLKSADGKAFPGITVSFTTVPPTLKILSFLGGGKNFLVTTKVTDVDRNFSAVIKFDHPLDGSTLSNSSIVMTSAGSGAAASINWTLSDSNKTLNIVSTSPLIHFEKYSFFLSAQVKGTDGAIFPGYLKDFYTAIDTTPKFPVVSDDELLNIVEAQTFHYFWDFAHPASGLARERNTSGDIVTIGGSGFGVMTIVVAIQRNFISRQEGVDRLQKIVDFLTAADRFHGAWPHWMNGNTGDVIPFGEDDNGADLVETAYMMQGLLTVRQFLNPSNSQENDLITKINALWNSVEWDWFTKGGQNVLYWHWSPDKGWIMNMQIKGYDEALITYILAAASPTHAIAAPVYDNGWASNGAIENGNSYYGYTLPLGQAFGGPLFFAHYSFLGFNPTNLKDDYANYWEQNLNHTLINRAYCIDNPADYVGYSSQCWGLTASDNQSGYSAQSPTNDLGVITPTAALSSFPYTPEYSMDALKFFYYTIGDKLWGPYGFYDAFNPTAGWYASSDLAIDEGPIIIMIENYRTGLLWNLFMSNPEIAVAMNKLGFTN